MRASAMLGMLLVGAAQGALNNQQTKAMNDMIAGLPTQDGKIRRSKVKPDRPSKKTNRGNISARVRRRHRRS